jgi:hypothetical protein
VKLANAETTEKLKRISIDGIQSLVSYALAVGKEIGNEKAFKILLEARAERYTNAHIRWARENMGRLGITGSDAIAAYELTEAFFKDTQMYTFGHLMAEPKEAAKTQYVERGPKRVVIRHDLWCPLLEGCTNLGVQTRYLCENFAFPEWEKVVRSVVNPRFVLRANRIRPEAPYCEEVYEIGD